MMKAKVIDYTRSMLVQKNMTKKLIMNIISVVLMGFGIALFSLSKMGVDPYTAMNMSIASKIGVSFGVWQLCLNLLIISLIVMFAHRGLIGVGTVRNMVGVGFICDFFKSLLLPLLKISNLFESLLIMSVGLVFLCFSASLFFSSNIGVGAYDTIGFMLTRKTGIKYKWCRVFTDFLVIAIAFAIDKDKNMGVGTFITAFCMGPLVSFFNKSVSMKILNFDYEKAGRKALVTYIKGLIFTHASPTAIYTVAK